MPLRAAQLFVRCRSLEELGAALQRAAPAGDRVALQQGEWGTLVCEAIDPALARLLSERFGTALALDLDGGRLALVVQTWEEGTPGDEERDPQPPGFRDVEAAAWELLDYLGVPAALRLLALSSIELLPEGSATPALLSRGAHLHAISAVAPAREEGKEPPVEPDVVVESQAGESRALEVRVLPGGIPTEAWAQALAAVEEAQARRLLRALASGEEPRMPRPTFAYRSLQALRVEKLLAAARRERPWLWKLLGPDTQPPLTLAGFTQLCRTKLRDAPVVRAHGGHLELAAGDACVRAPVREVYEVYLSSLDEEPAAAQLAECALALLASSPAALRADQLLPTVLAGDPGLRVARPLAAGLHAALLADDGTRIAPVLLSDLAALGLGADAAFERAVRNLDALTEAAPQGFRWFDLEHGRVVLCEFPDAGCAGRLLSRQARELLLAILGTGAALAAAPTRDALLACAADDEDGAAWLADESRSRFEEGPFPIHPGLWSIELDEIHAR